MSLPALPDSFVWIDAYWGPALRCTPLHAIAPHIFTTRHLALSSHQDWSSVAEAVGARQVQTLTQVHGRGVHVIRCPDRLRQRRVVSRADEPVLAADPAPPDRPGGPPKHPAKAEGLRHTRELRHARPEADVLVSNDPGMAIAVRAADCVPVLLADPITGAVAAAHAGWRGTAADAATAAVEALEREFGARPSDLVAAIGPSIGPCCYEVGTELVDAFAAAGHARHLIDRWFPAPPPGRGAYARGKLHLDTWGANRDQLILAGLDEQNVHVCGLCTADNLELFPSFRKEKESAGRMAGVIRSP